MARARLGQAGLSQPGQPGPPQPGPASGAQPGWAAEPQAGPVPGAQPGWAGQPQAGPQPGWAAEPQAGSLPGSSRWQGRSRPAADLDLGDGSIEDDIAGAAIGMAARFIGRAISRRVQDKLAQQVLPAMAARQEGALRQQVEIAERHPDLCACLTDHVIFLAGGSRTEPMPNIMTVTVEQADALVARLRDG